MASIGWPVTIPTYASYMTTTLNALANNTTVLGPEIDNSTNRDMFLDLIVILASLDLSAQVNPSMPFYLIKSDDAGTPVYEDGVSTATEALIPAADHIIDIVTFRVGSAAEAKNSSKTRIPIPQGKWKLMPRNKTGVALAATGNSIQYRTYKIESV